MKYPLETQAAARYRWRLVVTHCDLVTDATSAPQRSFDVADDEVVSYRCHGPRFPPQFVAGMIKPDLWITLRRS